LNILLINVPSRKGEGGLVLPLGLLYVGDILERNEHNTKIIDMYTSDFNSLDKLMEEFKPSIVGFGGISSSYGGTKKLSLYIKEKYPKVIQIAGGPLASTYDLLLKNTKVSVVFHGEVDLNLPVFLKKIESEEPFIDIKGISYLADGQVMRNPPEILITNIDEIPYPAYHLVDMHIYALPVETLLNAYDAVLRHNPQLRRDVLKKIEGKKLRIPILASRGCTNRCFFCYRHVFGHRQHSVKYVIDHIKYLQKEYNISGFQFSDELFNRNQEWILEFCDAIEREKLDIFYIVGGARIDKINEQLLLRLKQTGCVEIGYGQESGSDIILREYRKGVSRQQNKEITLLTQNLGIMVTVQLVIGSPSETNETIHDTINFLRECKCYMVSLNYLIPLPETPSWQYVTEHSLINDVEKYLDDVAEYGGMRMLVNLTNEPDDVVRSWYPRICYETTRNYYKFTNQTHLYLLYTLFGRTRKYLEPFLPNETKGKIRSFLRKYHLRG